MRTLITFSMDSGILGALEYTASSKCELIGDDITARDTQVTVFVPGGTATTGKHMDVTHLISETEIDNIAERIMEAYMIRKHPDKLNVDPKTEYIN